MPDEALAALDLRNASSVDIETDHAKSAFHRRHGQGNTDIAKTDDADAGCQVFEGSQQILRIQIEWLDFYKLHSTPPFSGPIRSELRHVSALSTRLLSAIQRPDITPVNLMSFGGPR